MTGHPVVDGRTDGVGLAGDDRERPQSLAVRRVAPALPEVAISQRRNGGGRRLASRQVVPLVVPAPASAPDQLKLS
jgi:hypothetical protein